MQLFLSPKKSKAQRRCQVLFSGRTNEWTNRRSVWLVATVPEIYSKRNIIIIITSICWRSWFSLKEIISQSFNSLHATLGMKHEARTKVRCSFETVSWRKIKTNYYCCELIASATKMAIIIIIIMRMLAKVQEKLWHKHKHTYSWCHHNNGIAGEFTLHIFHAPA